jgi:hypothetical protein
MPPQWRRPKQSSQQQGGNDLPSQQQYGELTPVDEKLPEPRKPDIEEPDDALEEDHYDRIV